MNNQFFDDIDQVVNAYRAARGLDSLERCDCGKPATYLGMCNGCYHSVQIATRESLHE